MGIEARASRRFVAPRVSTRIRRPRLSRMYRNRSVHCAGEEVSEHRCFGHPQPRSSHAFRGSDKPMFTVNPLPPRMYSGGVERTHLPNAATAAAGRGAPPALQELHPVRPHDLHVLLRPGESSHTSKRRSSVHSVHSIDTRRVHLDAVVVTPKDDFPKAALKHLQDGQALLKTNRFDGAAYLAGYVVECALKTMIGVENKKVPRIHDLSELQSRIQALSVVAGSRTGHVYIAITQAIDQILPGHRKCGIANLT